jgi:uncharacterized protein
VSHRADEATRRTRNGHVKLICIEEHAIDPAIAHAAQPALQREAPYMGLQSSPNAASQPRDGHRPVLVEMSEAIELGTDLGDGRIRNMGEHGIDMQVVSYSSPIFHRQPSSQRRREA